MRKLLNDHFPRFGVKNIGIYYLLTAVMASFYIEGNWIYFWKMFMDYHQLGILDAAGFAFGFLMEVPTGAIADMLGKKKTIVFGMLIGSAGMTMQALGNVYSHFFIGFLLTHLFWALYSGAAEALVYDSLKQEGKEDKYDQVIASGSFIFFIVFTISVLAGGLMYQIYFRLPSIAWASATFIGAIFAMYLTEPKIDTEKFSFKNYWKQLNTGFKGLLSPPLKKFFVLFFVLSGAAYLYDWGLIKPILGVNFGFSSFWLAVVLATIAVISGIVVKVLPKIKRLTGDIQGLILLGIILSFGFWLASFKLGNWGVVPMLILGASGALINPWISIIVNKDTDSKYRATTLSTIALLSKLPYVLVAVLAGNAAQSNDLNIFMRVLMAVLVAGIVLGFWFYRKNLATETKKSF